jgi:general secretion pathway protein J
MSRHKIKGFTLLEILIAVFIFTIVSMIMTHALATVFHSNAGTEKHSTRLAELQMATLFLARDAEQIINRPVMDAKGTLRPTFEGYAKQVTFTHGGLANPSGKYPRTTMQRTSYSFDGNSLVRQVWPVLDSVQSTMPQQRKLLNDVSEMHFDYLDEKGFFHNTWPPAEQTKSSPLPRAVRITITLAHWGKLTQLYLIAAHIPGGT